ncbi:MAG: hypothetical protein ACXAEU_17755 [Candidatus Hodarchaeales archaeon]|jgi:IS605 OrfB family transposase
MTVTGEPVSIATEDEHAIVLLPFFSQPSIKDSELEKHYPYIDVFNTCLDMCEFRILTSDIKGRDTIFSLEPFTTVFVRFLKEITRFFIKKNISKNRKERKSLSFLVERGLVLRGRFRGRDVLYLNSLYFLEVDPFFDIISKTLSLMNSSPVIDLKRSVRQFADYDLEMLGIDSRDADHATIIICPEGSDLRVLSGDTRDKTSSFFEITVERDGRYEIPPPVEKILGTEGLSLEVKSGQSGTILVKGDEFQPETSSTPDLVEKISEESVVAFFLQHKGSRLYLRALRRVFSLEVDRIITALRFKKVIAYRKGNNFPFTTFYYFRTEVKMLARFMKRYFRFFKSRNSRDRKFLNILMDRGLVLQGFIRQGYHHNVVYYLNAPGIIKDYVLFDTLSRAFEYSGDSFLPTNVSHSTGQFTNEQIRAIGLLDTSHPKFIIRADNLQILPSFPDGYKWGKHSYFEIAISNGKFVIPVPVARVSGVEGWSLEVIEHPNGDFFLVKGKIQRMITPASIKKAKQEQKKQQLESDNAQEEVVMNTVQLTYEAALYLSEEQRFLLWNMMRRQQSAKRIAINGLLEGWKRQDIVERIRQIGILTNARYTRSAIEDAKTVIASQRELVWLYKKESEWKYRQTTEMLMWYRQKLSNKKGLPTRQQVWKLKGMEKRQRDALKNKNKWVQHFKDKTLPTIVFGGRKILLNYQKKLYDYNNGLVDRKEVDIIYKMWKNKRMNGLYCVGEKLVKGNPNLRVLYCPLIGFAFSILLDQGIKHKWGKRMIALLHVPSRYEATFRQYSLGTLVSKKKYNGPAYTVRLLFPEHGDHIRVLISSEHQNRVISNGNGIAGIDLNPAGIAVTLLYPDGNFYSSKWFHQPELVDARKNRRKWFIGNTVKEIFGWVASHGINTLAIEELKFSKKYGSKHKFNRVKANFAYHKLIDTIYSRAIKLCFAVKVVNPAFTSLLGKILYGSHHGLNDHQAAAMIIGRRGLGFGETLWGMSAELFIPPMKNWTSKQKAEMSKAIKDLRVSNGNGIAGIVIDTEGIVVTFLNRYGDFRLSEWFKEPKMLKTGNKKEKKILITKIVNKAFKMIKKLGINTLSIEDWKLSEHYGTYCEFKYTNVNFLYVDIINEIKSQANKQKFHIKEVNPAFASVLGELLYSHRYGLNSQQTTALVFGRRGLGFTEQIRDVKSNMSTIVIPPMKGWDAEQIKDLGNTLKKIIN